MGASKSAMPEHTPLQLVALEERVLYSAGPIPAEVVDAALVSQGDSQGVDANDLGLNSIDMTANGTLEYLQQQVDAANALDSIDAFEPLELVPSDLGDGDDLDVDVSSVQLEQIAGQIIDAEVAAVSTDLQRSERVAQAVSITIGSGVDISGRILHDVDGDGAGDVVGGENLILEGVEVRLYQDQSNGKLTNGDVQTNGFLTDFTDDQGKYEFNDLAAGNNYFIVVNSATLGANLTFNDGYDADDVIGVQTYAAAGALFEDGNDIGESSTDGAFYGGFSIDRSDKSADPEDVRGFEHIIKRADVNGDQTNVDFGFSFNVVTNTLAGGSRDDYTETDSGRTVQGSLRQFITNANAIAGDNEMRFVPVENETYTSQESNSDIWLINVTKSLPNIIDAGTTISGLTYQTNGLRYEPPEADVTPEGAANGVGVFDALVGPDLYSSLTLKGPLDAFPNRQFAGLVIEAANVEVSNLSVVNFQTGIVVKGADSSNVHIEQNFIGAHSDGTNGEAVQTIGITVEIADEGTISNNYILNSETTGVLISGSLATGNQAENWTITNNYIADLQDVGNDFADGIGLTGGTQGALVFNNRIENAKEFGIDLFNNRGAVTIANNAITDSGHERASDGEDVGGAIGLASAGNTIQFNEFTDNDATGILVRGTAVEGAVNLQSATGNRISQNYFENNEGLDIDIINPQDGLAEGEPPEISAGDGMDALREGFDADIGSSGIDYPVLTSVSLIGDTLSIRGSYFNEIDNAQIELYLIGSNESKRYFDTIEVTDQTSFDSETGTFTAELVEPAEGWPVDFTADDQLAAIIIDSDNNTSEFSLATTIAQGFTVSENDTAVFGNVDPGDEIVGTFLQFTKVDGADADLFNLRADNGALSFSNQADFENPGDGDQDGVYSLTIHVTDDLGNESFRAVNVTVTDVLEIATVENEHSQPENQANIFNLSAQPENNATFEYVIEPGEDAALFEFFQEDGENNGRFRFITAPDFENKLDADNNNIYTFTVTATSNIGHTVTDTIEVTVTDDPNDNPPLESIAYEQFENEIAIHELDQTSDDNRTFTSFQFEGGSIDQFDFDTTTGKFFLKNAPDFENPTDGGANPDNVYSFTVSSLVGSEVVTTRDIDLTVKDVLEFNETSFEQRENRVDPIIVSVNPGFGEFTYQLNGGDDSDAVTLNADGSLTLNDAPDFETQADADLNGEYSISVVATSIDNPAVFVTSDITIAVTDLTEIVETEFQQTENEISPFVIETGVNEDPFTYELLDGLDSAAFNVNSDGSFVFNTAPDFEDSTSVGADNEYQFVVRAINVGSGQDEMHTITVNVSDLTEISGTEFQQTENTILPLAIETGANEDPFTYELLDGLDSAAFTVNSDGSFEFNTAPDFENSTSVGADNEYQFVVRATNVDSGQDESHTITVSVTNLTEIVKAEFQQDENRIEPFVLENNALEVPFTYELVDGLDSDAFTVNSDGNFSFKNAPDFEDPTNVGTENEYQFVVRATNGDSGQDELHTITVSVADATEILETSFQQRENTTTPLVIETGASDHC